MRARDNPYRTERLHSLKFRFSEMDWEGLRLRFLEMGARGCLLGREGSGKTTLLLAFADRLRESGLSIRQVTVRADKRDWRDDFAGRAALGPRDVLVVDGADLLGPLQWRRLKSETCKAFGLLATSHRRRLLPVLYHCRTTSRLLRDLMGELHPQAGCAQPDSDELFRRHHGNLRDALRELYDYHAGLADGVGCA